LLVVAKEEATEVEVEVEVEMVEEEKFLLTMEEKEDMAKDNYALVYFVAHKFTNTGYDIEELASVATVGYVRALNAFDKSRNIRFSTYSVNCMRNEILFFLRKEKKHRNNNISMSFTLSTDRLGNDFSIEDIISDKSQYLPTTADKVESREDSELLYEALKHLTENERHIAIYRFGLDQGIQKTQREIAEDIGMSQANVSKIEKSLLVKLKSILTKDYNMLWKDDAHDPEEAVF